GRLEGVWGDSCSTWSLGEPSAELVTLHAVAVEALREGVLALRPGTLAGQVDDRVRAVMRDGGYEIPHHVGHGVGFAFHEVPRLTTHRDRLLQAGMVIAIE